MDRSLPKENQWYYLKRECLAGNDISSIRDSLTSSLSIFSGVSTFDEATSISGQTSSSYLATNSTLASHNASYISVYGGSTTGGGSLYSSVYSATKTSSYGASTYLQAQQDNNDWKNVPSSAAALTNSNQPSGQYIDTTNSTTSASASAYVDSFTEDTPSPQQTTGSSGLATSSGSSAYSSPYDLSFSEKQAIAHQQLQGTINGQPTDPQLQQIQKKMDTQPAKPVLPWNEAFQELLDRPINSHEEERLRNHNIAHFSQILANTATKYIRTLVQEVHIAPDMKSIKPFDAGGFAGGEKFVIDNMFIKFALNPHSIYERNNPVSYFANKAAGHELKSINALVSCGVPNLHFPLMCLVNYRGFRLIVISELPINAHTLVFGSSNAGETIHENETVFKMMVKIGEILNLQTHKVEERGKVNSKQFTIPLAIDIEGHFGVDGRYYVVDTARLFPPETPVPGITGGHLYRLFRPEFVRRYEKQLCSDAFAAFNVVDQEPFNDEAVKANNYLIQEYVPAILQKSVLVANLEKLNLKHLFHKDGINMRYLGLMLYHLTNLKTVDPIILYKLQGLLSVEMVARLMRFILFSEMRQINSTADQPHLDMALSHINLLISDNRHYWSHYLGNALVAKYAYTCTTLPDVELKVGQFIKSANGLLKYINARPPTSTAASPFPDSYYGAKKELNFKYKLLKKISVLTGLVISAKTLKDFKAKRVTQLAIEDITEIAVTVKHMNVSSSFKTAEFHYKEAIAIYVKRFGDDIGTANFKEKLALCNIKQKKFKEATDHLESVISIKKKIFNGESIEVADSYDNLAWACQSQKEFEKANNYYQMALTIKLDKGSHQLSIAKTLNNMGHLRLSLNQLEKSLEIFNRVLDIFVKQYGQDHSDVAVALDNIALIYAKTKEYAKAESYFNQTLTIRIKQFGEDSRFVALTKDHLAQLYLAWGKSKYGDAERLFRECIKISEKYPDHYLKGFLRYNYSKLYKLRKDKTLEENLLKDALQIFETHSVATDLTAKIHDRLEQLKKSGLGKIINWLGSSSTQKKNSQIQISQHHDGRMQNSSNTNSNQNEIPEEWQDILKEAGIKADLSDPKLAEAIKNLELEEFDANKKGSFTEAIKTGKLLNNGRVTWDTKNAAAIEAPAKAIANGFGQLTNALNHKKEKSSKKDKEEKEKVTQAQGAIRTNLSTISNIANHTITKSHIVDIIQSMSSSSNSRQSLNLDDEIMHRRSSLEQSVSDHDFASIEHVDPVIKLDSLMDSRPAPITSLAYPPPPSATSTPTVQNEHAPVGYTKAGPISPYVQAQPAPPAYPQAQAAPQPSYLMQPKPLPPQQHPLPPQQHPLPPHQTGQFYHQSNQQAHPPPPPPVVTYPAGYPYQQQQQQQHYQHIYPTTQQYSQQPYVQQPQQQYQHQYPQQHQQQTHQQSPYSATTVKPYVNPQPPPTGYGAQPTSHLYPSPNQYTATNWAPYQAKPAAAYPPPAPGGPSPYTTAPNTSYLQQQPQQHQQHQQQQQQQRPFVFSGAASFVPYEYNSQTPPPPPQPQHTIPQTATPQPYTNYPAPYKNPATAYGAPPPPRAAAGGHYYPQFAPQTAPTPAPAPILYPPQPAAAPPGHGPQAPHRQAYQNYQQSTFQPYQNPTAAPSVVAPPPVPLQFHQLYPDMNSSYGTMPAALQETRPHNLQMHENYDIVGEVNDDDDDTSSNSSSGSNGSINWRLPTGADKSHIIAQLKKLYNN
ncbi:hypothetical protein SAMD00019534_053080 [Acytostelium subglobosum LB1]|uniref:hypothetical protein n=1 Tax=Acytostelium subglobosum LB1 TaxID=1410327 RepID=UPI0006447E61|nr:hypothetical protein SAMD00019534_053080 [Acytostelium subglobosum LB1]GAM22133.1 hypothetical protein SAMD00019534_053080 [Acytostelium subglobosum LB1]|eukprot:XP_012755233.1 hypothetical protein SAMD00019534_053080 [Acytostelium subglobosum LB1]